MGFHFHPMIYFEGWEVEYQSIVERILENFLPEEVLFLSLGTITFIKPVMQKIREMGNSSKILQMDFAQDPKGKLTYPDEIKVLLFNHMLKALSPWKEKVFMYLCMEKASIWQQTLGYAYPTNEDFERVFGRAVMSKVYPSEKLI